MIWWNIELELDRSKLCNTQSSNNIVSLEACVTTHYCYLESVESHCQSQPLDIHMTRHQTYATFILKAWHTTLLCILQYRQTDYPPRVEDFLLSLKIPLWWYYPILIVDVCCVPKRRLCRKKRLPICYYIVDFILFYITISIYFISYATYSEH